MLAQWRSYMPGFILVPNLIINKMRNFILLLTLVSFTFASAQYEKIALGVEFGVHAVGDESATVTDMFNHYGVSARYSLSDRFSVGLSGGFDNLTLRNHVGEVVETNYSRINAEGTIELFDMLHLYSKRVTLLGHAGPGISFIRNDVFNENTFNLSGGLTFLVKLTQNFAAKADYSGTVNINHDRTLDGWTEITNAGINSTVSNLSVGLVFYPGKKKKEHADWYVAPEPVYTYNEVVNNYITREYVRNITENSCNCDAVEFVFFDHDKDDLKETGLNAITKAYNYLDNNPTAKLYIRGFASATKSSNEYNIDLARRRGGAVYNKLQQMGADMDRVSVSTIGKDFNWAKEITHDVSRRVELIITKQ